MNAEESCILFSPLFNYDLSKLVKDVITINYLIGPVTVYSGVPVYHLPNIILVDIKLNKTKMFLLHWVSLKGELIILAIQAYSLHLHD